MRWKALAEIYTETHKHTCTDTLSGTTAARFCSGRHPHTAAGVCAAYLHPPRGREPPARGTGQSTDPLRKRSRNDSARTVVCLVLLRLRSILDAPLRITFAPLRESLAPANEKPLLFMKSVLAPRRQTRVGSASGARQQRAGSAACNFFGFLFSAPFSSRFVVSFWVPFGVHFGSVRGSVFMFFDRFVRWHFCRFWEAFRLPSGWLWNPKSSTGSPGREKADL